MFVDGRLVVPTADAHGFDQFSFTGFFVSPGKSTEFDFDNFVAHQR